MATHLESIGVTLEEKRAIILSWIKEALTARVKDFDWKDLATEGLEIFEEAVCAEERVKAQAHCEKLLARFCSVTDWEVGHNQGCQDCANAIRDAGE